MLELSPCLDLLFAEDDRPPRHADRIRRAAAAGFTWAEMWGWREADVPAIETALRETGVTLNLLTSEPMARIVDPATHETFLEGVAASAAIAARLGAPHIVVLAGDTLPGEDRAGQSGAVVAALRRAAPVAADHGVTLLLENLNSRVDHVGHFLDRTPDALDLVDAVGHPSLRLLYDLYHAAVMDERTAEVLAGRLDRVGHVQIADTPGRHEPGSGRVDWDAELGWLVDAGYRGRIGLEYTPTTDTTTSLGRIRALMDGLRAGIA
jgi:hydroxypyruvate isomerase